jgi:hypothetical protein
LDSPLPPAALVPAAAGHRRRLGRIIQRHGGRTWAEGAVGGGASMYVTLDASEVSWVTE